MSPRHFFSSCHAQKQSKLTTNWKLVYCPGTSFQIFLLRISIQNVDFLLYAVPPPAPSVLQKSKNAYSQWFLLFNNFPKVYRYTLGGKVEAYFLELLENIFVSLYLKPDQKITRLTIAISKLDGVKFFLQIAWENKCVPNEGYATLSEKLDEIGKMLGGWKKGLETKTPAQ